MLGESSYLYPQEKLEGTFLTREQIDEISTRIAQSAIEMVSQQLRDALTSVRSGESKLN